MGREKTTNLEIEARKEKKKFKEKRNNDEPDRNSSLIEVPVDKMDEVVQVQKLDKNDGTSRKSGEGAKKKKQRKREMDGADSELKSNVANEQEVVNDSEKSSGKIAEEADIADNEKKRKKLFEDDKMGEAAKRFKCSEDRDAAKINKVEVDKKKKKKEKREKIGGESVENIITEGKEAGVENEQSDEQIMDKAQVDKKKKKRKVKEQRENMGGEFITEGKEAGVGIEQSDGQIMDNAQVDKKKRKKKMKEQRENMGGEFITEGKEAGVESEQSDGQIMDKVDVGKKKKKKKTEEQREKMGGELVQNIIAEGNEARADKGSLRTIEDVNVKDGNKKKKRAKSDKHVDVGDCNKDNKKKARADKGSLRTPKIDRAPDLSENSKPRKASKRVTFSDDVEVFQPSDGPKDPEMGLVQGKRFSKEEDELVRKAVLTYIEEHSLGDEGINKVLNSRSNPEVRNCWKDIGAFLPWRPSKSIYYRAHMLFERGKERNWTAEEYEEVRRAAMESRGKGEAKPNWRKVGNELGKHRIHVKDAWRRIKLPNLKKGHWSQEEYQTLFDLVNKDLQMKVLEEKKSKHGMLRDNIKWEAISETLGTRTNPSCCMKWYNQLSSPLVAEKVWADVDDYHLVVALDSLDACCMEDVDFDNLLEHRSGDVCRKRWKEMVRHLGEHRTKSFAEQVEIMSKRYCPDVLEAREVFDSKPVVD